MTYIVIFVAIGILVILYLHTKSNEDGVFMSKTWLREKIYQHREKKDE